MERPRLYATFPRLHLYAVFLLLNIYVCSLIQCIVHGEITVDYSSGPEVEVSTGHSITLVCDLNNVEDTNIYWYVASELTDISKNRAVTEESYAERFTITGNETLEEFNLHIDNVQVSDAGIYKCVYYILRINGYNRQILVPTELVVLHAPTEESPVCSVFPTVGTIIDFIPGDSVRLQCDTDDGSPPPNLSWLHNELLLASGSGTIQTRVRLTSDNYNEVFLCLMQTPALNETRNCSVIPLKRKFTTSTFRNELSTADEGSSLRTQSRDHSKVTTTYKHTQLPEIRTSFGGQNPIMKQQNIIIISAAAGGAFILFLMIIIIIIVMCCCKNNKSKGVSKPANRPATGEYEMVTPQEPLDRNRTADDNLYVNTDVQSSNQDGHLDDDQPRRPVVTSGKHIGLGRKIDADVGGSDEEEHLVYADLDLNKSGDDIIQTDDPTIYAKVKV
ncbi:uncharacterized protein [Amphiura filiformis]|uniref:uncharacterized protein n=1 Tax=Amphiura filiformis TaxID=82378 RepID=UPI003B21BCCA